MHTLKNVNLLWVESICKFSSFVLSVSVHFSKNEVRVLLRDLVRRTETSVADVIYQDSCNKQKH